VLGDFKARVEKYDALRKKADDSAPPLEKSNSPEKIKDAQHGLAERIGAARVGGTGRDLHARSRRCSSGCCGLKRRCTRPRRR
jgi:hypothetical protein